MAVSDSIADLLTVIRNASLAKRRYLDLPASKLRVEIVKILQEQGFIEKFMVQEEDHRATMRVYLKYAEGRIPVIQGLKRVSRPSCRRYIGYREIPRIMGGMGISILSTSQGIMVGQQARQQKVGGELLCQVW